VRSAGATRLALILSGAALSLTSAVPAMASVMPAAPHVLFTHATLTAPDSHGNVALSVDVRNESAQSVTLLSIADTPSQGFMFFTAPSIVTGNGAMSYAANVSVRAHHNLQLGYTHVGAMLSSVPSVRVGTIVPLTIHWTTPRGVDYTTVVRFRTVAAPAHLRFVMR